MNQNLPNTRTSCNTASRTLPPIPRMHCTTARTATKKCFTAQSCYRFQWCTTDAGSQLQLQGSKRAPVHSTSFPPSFFFGVPTQSCDVTDRVFHGYFVTLQVDFHKLKDTCMHSFVVFVYEWVWMIMRKLAFDVLNACICMYMARIQLTNGIYRICWAVSILPSKPSKSFTSCFPLSVSLSHF